MIRGTVLPSVLLLLVGWSPAWADQGAAFQVESQLRAAAAKVDITPPAGTKVVGHVRLTDGVRDPLHVVVLLLDDGRTKAALVTLDLINSGEEMVRQLR